MIDVPQQLVRVLSENHSSWRKLWSSEQCREYKKSTCFTQIYGSSKFGDHPINQGQERKATPEKKRLEKSKNIKKEKVFYCCKKECVRQ